MGPELALVLGGAQAAMSLAQADQQNKASRRAADVQKEQNRIAADQRKRQLAAELQEFQGSLRTTSAARGTAGAASSAAIGLSATNTANVGNANLNIQRIFGDASADSQAAARYQNPLAAGFSGALSGFSTGLSLGNGMNFGGSGTFGSAADWNNLGAAVRFRV